METHEPMDENVDMTRLPAYFRALLDGVNDAVTIVNPQGVVLFWNRAAEAIYQIPRSEIVGRPIDGFFPAGSVMLYKVLDSRLPVYDLYHRPREDKHVIINALPIFDAQGALIGAISIERDITEHVALTEALYDQGRFADTSDTAEALHDVDDKKRSTLAPLSARLREAVRQNLPVLLLGEAGSGRQALAADAHRRAGKTGPFIVLSSRTLPEGFLAAELFGFERPGDNKRTGAGALVETGLLERAADGTLYIKDIHLWPLRVQEALSSALASGTFTRQGGSTPIPLKAQIIATAEAADSEHLQDERWLPELYYRFHVFTVPPLRARRADLPVLARFYLEQASRALGRPAPKLSKDALAALVAYDWPGNLPQLRNTMEYVAIMANDGTVQLHDLPEAIRRRTLSHFSPETRELGSAVRAHTPRSLSDWTEQFERTRIVEALARTGGNKSKAAAILGISRGALYYKLKQYGLLNPSSSSSL
ncbi:MAG: sigma 54-interacting transcriptional regulator [Hydrogenibacillus sp.]|nr:sigma 54-interacting transcriptional regulator [Hydrogenibacillus sp.]